MALCVYAKSPRSCPPLCNAMDYSLPGSSVHGILQAGILEWVAVPSSRGSSSSRNWTHLSYLLHWQAGSLPLAPLGKPINGIIKTQLANFVKFLQIYWPKALLLVFLNLRFTSFRIHKFSLFETVSGCPMHLAPCLFWVITDERLLAAKSLQLCPTLCDPIDGSSPCSSIPGILQARILEWVAISFSNALMHAESLQSCPILYGQQPARLLCPQDSLGKNIGVGCHFLLQTDERRYSNISKAWLLLLKMQNISVEQSCHSSLSGDKDLEHQTWKCEILSLEKTHPEGLSSTLLERFLLSVANWPFCCQTPGNRLLSSHDTPKKQQILTGLHIICWLQSKDFPELKQMTSDETSFPSYTNQAIGYLSPNLWWYHMFRWSPMSVILITWT